MHAQLINTTRLDHPPSLDAVETLKAVQVLINAYLANGTSDGRSAIPTPEPSPVPKCMEDGKRESEMNESQEDAALYDADFAGGTMSTDIKLPRLGEVNGPQPGINAAEATSSIPQVRGTTQHMPVDQGGCGIPSGEGVNSSLFAEKVCTGRPQIGLTNGDSSASNTIQDNHETSHPTAAQDPEQDRLRHLADEITCNVHRIATDDAARIKAATAALELAAAVRPPGDTIMGWFANMSVISAVRLFLHWGAFDIIPSGKEESITYTELARQVHADEGLVVRVASMLTSSHVLAHHPPSPSHPSPRLSHTPTSLLLVSGQPMSAMFTLMYTNVTHVSAILPSYFDTYGRTEPLGPAHIPTSYLAGRPEEDFFSLLKKDEAALSSFGLAMRMTSRRVPVTGMYDMSRVLQAAAEEERETVWVDVGGGDGHTVKEFLREYPGLKAEQCVVQDLEEVVRAAEQQGDDELKGVRWVGMDFLREPPVKGALIYYLRHIARDYSDPVFTTILRNVARAMTDPDSRVLISEQLSRDVSSMAGPLPLYAAFKDFSMLSIGGKERSLQQFAAVADAAGLRVSGLFRDGATPHAVVELALKDDRDGNLASCVPVS